jgi:hypothetical protein
MKVVNAMLAALLFVANADAAQWQLESTIDAMTDLPSERAFIENADGDRLTILQRSNGSVWGFLSLGGGLMFGSSRQGVRLRVDRHPVVGYSEGTTAYEWNPTLAGFQMRPAGSYYCGIFRHLHEGTMLTVRYFPSDSTQRDIRFELDPSSADVILTASGVDLDLCTRIEDWKASVMAKGLAKWEKPASLEPGTRLSFAAKINAQGRLLNLSWLERSGKRRIDRPFINAFNAAAPFDPPPAGFNASQGVVFSYVERPE